MSYNPNDGHQYLPPPGSHPPAYPGGPAVHYAPPTVIVSQPPVVVTGSPRLVYSTTTSVCLGVAQLFLAIGSITGGIMAIVFGSSLYYIGVGIWCGAFYLVAGSVALAAGNNPTKSLVKATAVTSGFNIAFGITEVAIAGCGVSQDIYCSQNECYARDGSVIAANCLMIGAGSWQIIFGIWLLAVSCHALSNNKSNPQVSVVPVTYVTGSSGAVLVPAHYHHHHQQQQQQPVQDYYHQPYAAGSSYQPPVMFHTQDHHMQPKGQHSQPQ